MTTVRRLSVDGLAGRKNPVEYELSPDINVFFGLNGTGKTSLLRLINAALRDRVETLRRVAFQSATIELALDDEEVVVRSLTREELLRNREPRYFVDEDGDVVTASGTVPPRWRSRPPKFRGPLETTFLSTSRLMGIDSLGRPRSARTSDLSEQALDERFAEEVQILWRRYTNKTLSDVRQIQQAGLATILQSLFSSELKPWDALDARAAFQRSKEFLRRQGVTKFQSFSAFSDLYSNDARLSTIVHEIDDIENLIERAEEPRRRLQRLVSQFLGEQKDIEFSDREISVRFGGEQIPLTTLSSGEKQLLRILVEVVNAGPGVVIIDEPELSMHIDWQRSLVQGLRTINPDAQIIVATHSPEIMAEVPDSRIHRL